MIELFCSEGFRIFIKAWFGVILACFAYLVLRGGVILFTLLSTTTYSIDQFIYQRLLAYALICFTLFFVGGVGRSIKAGRLKFTFSLREVVLVFLLPFMGYFIFVSILYSPDKGFYMVPYSLLVFGFIFYVLRRVALSKRYF